MHDNILISNMNSAFWNLLAFFLQKYYPEELDQSLKPIDSAGNIRNRNIKFDFTIVGAGSAGCVLANRLSENPDWKILLIEAGGDEDYITDTPHVSLLMYDGTKYDWNYTTVPLKYTCQGLGGICPYPRGHVMGGSSTINGMMYVRGNAEDFDNWAAMGNPGWSYKDVLPYFRKIESITIPELTTSPYHGVGGPLSVGYARYNTTFLKDVFAATMQLGYPETDYNGESQYGISYTQFSLKGATRCSTSKAYLDPIRQRKNLYIFKNTMATKVILAGEPKKAIGVRCITGGKEYNVYSSKEVILSAGAINSPKLLMLSGIGPKEDLAKLDIQVHKDLPVGKNFLDHCGLQLDVGITEPELNFPPKRANETIIDYAKCKEGVLSSPNYVISGFLNSTSHLIDAQIIVSFSTKGLSQNSSNLTLYVVNVRPKSVGTIKLRSKNYLDPPLIDPNFFQVPSDRFPLYWGMKKLIKIIKSPILMKYMPVTTNLCKDCNNCDHIDIHKINNIIKNNNFNGLHGCGTAKMGPSNDKTAVVDAALNVHGIEGLRVVDASIFPRITTGNTNAPTIMVGEKAADLIKSFYSKC